MILHFEAAIFGGMYNNDGIKQYLPVIFRKQIKQIYAHDRIDLYIKSDFVGNNC